VPEHLREMPPLGWSFVVAAALGVGIAFAVLSGRDDRRPLGSAGRAPSDGW
jgi:hypothetical protein